jgi:hypothetical protein
LVFDAKRGGAIQPENFQYHPKSERKADTVLERAVMPNLGDVEPEFIPTPVSVLAGDRFSRIKLYGSAGELPSHLVSYSAGINLDGRFGAIARLMDGTRKKACFSIQRSLTCSDTEWRYTMDIRAHGAMKSFEMDDFDLESLVHALDTLLDADMLRLANRRSRLLGFPDIQLDVRPCPRSFSIENFPYVLESIICEKDIGPRVLPERFQFGIGVCLDGLMVAWYCSPDEWGEEEWRRSSRVDRDDYEEWRLKVGAVQNVGSRPT